LVPGPAPAGALAAARRTGRQRELGCWAGLEGVDFFAALGHPDEIEALEQGFDVIVHREPSGAACRAK